MDMQRYLKSNNLFVYLFVCQSISCTVCLSVNCFNVQLVDLPVLYYSGVTGVQFPGGTRGCTTFSRGHVNT